MTRRYRAVIFDMDGTIIDNMPYHVKVWVKLAASLGYQVAVERFEHEFAGKKNEEILAVLDPSLSPERVREIAREKERLYREAYAAERAPIAGFTRLLTALCEANVPCAIATAAPSENRDFILDGLSLRAHFAAVIGAEAVQRGKPHPDIFLAAAEAVSVEPRDCLVFEDAVNGVRAARAAGMDAVALLTTAGAAALEAAGACCTLRDYQVLPTALQAALCVDLSKDPARVNTRA